MDRKLSVFIFLIGLFVFSLFFGGETKYDPRADVNNDYTVNYKDLFILAANYGMVT